MSYPIERRIVQAIPKYKLRSKSYIIAHESGNANNAGNGSLEAEVSYMIKNWKNAFTHFWSDNKKIVQIAEDGYMCFGAGGYLNPHSPAQVELARVDTKAEFEESYKRYVWLLRYLADKHGIPKTLDSNERRGIKTHDWVSKNLGGTNHTDPYGYLAQWGISKAQFKRDIENGISGTVAVVKPASLWDKGYLMYGDRGHDVEMLQKYLNQVGFPVEVHGYYNAETKRAVMDFQEARGLGVDGYYGEKSRAEMNVALKEPKPKPEAETASGEQKEEITLAEILKLSTGEGRNAQLRVLKRFEKKDPALSAQWREKVEAGTFTFTDFAEVMFVAIDRGYISGQMAEAEAEE